MLMRGASAAGTVAVFAASAAFFSSALVFAKVAALAFAVLRSVSHISHFRASSLLRKVHAGQSIPGSSSGSGSGSGSGFSCSSGSAAEAARAGDGLSLGFSAGLAGENENAGDSFLPDFSGANVNGAGFPPDFLSGVGKLKGGLSKEIAAGVVMATMCSMVFPREVPGAERVCSTARLDSERFSLVSDEGAIGGFSIDKDAASSASISSAACLSMSSTRTRMSSIERSNAALNSFADSDVASLNAKPSCFRKRFEQISS